MRVSIDYSDLVFIKDTLGELLNSGEDSVEACADELEECYTMLSENVDKPRIITNGE